MPLQQSMGTEYDIFYPHDAHPEGVNTKDVIARSQLVLAEVSHPSTGQGIELGWADTSNVPIICFYRKGSAISGALRFVTQDFFEYTTTDDMIEQLRVAIEKSRA